MKAPKRSLKDDSGQVSSSKDISSTLDLLNKQDPFVDLAGPDKKEYKDFMGSEANPAQFLMPDGSVLPHSLAKDRLGCHMFLTIAGGRIAKRIALTISIAGANIRKMHHIYLEMYPGMDEVMDLSYSDFIATEAIQSEVDVLEINTCEVTSSASEVAASTSEASLSASDATSSTSEATLSGVDIPPSAIQVGRSGWDAAGCTHGVTVSGWDTPPSTSEASWSAWEALNSEFTPSTAELTPPEADYCEVEQIGNTHTQSGTVLQVQWKTRGGHGAGLTLPTADLDGESQTTIEHLKSLLFSQESTDQEIKLIVMGKPGLRKQLDTIASNKTHDRPWLPYLDEESKPKCSFTEMATRKHLTDHCGRLVRLPARNSFSTAEEAHISLSYGLYLEFRQAPYQGLRSSWPNTAEEVYLKCQLEALNALFRNEAPSSTKIWREVVLNQATEVLPVIDPAREMGLSPSNISANMEKVLNAFPWTIEQIAAIEMCRELRGRVGIVEGVYGSGKTHVLAAMAVFYALCGIGVLLLAPTRSQIRVLAHTLTKLLELTCNKHLRTLKLYPGELAYRSLKEPKGLPVNPDFSFVLTTPNAICQANLWDHMFLHEDLVVVYDDSDASLETEVLNTVFGLNNPSRVLGLILGGDIREWPLGVVSQVDMVRCVQNGEKVEDDSHSYSYFFTRFFKEDGLGRDVAIAPRNEPKETEPLPRPNNRSLEFYGGINEFADQIGLDLLSRLRRQGMVTAKLVVQHRMLPIMTDFPSKRTYGDSVQTSAAVTDRQNDLDFNNVLCQWLREGSESVDMSLVYLKASRGPGRCKKIRLSHSKHNWRNVEVVLDLLHRNQAAEAMPASDILIITPYAHQTEFYMQMFGEKLKRGQLTSSEVPDVVTIDQSRGRERRVVILDLVVTLGDSCHEIGIVASELRAHIAVTRAQDFLIIVGSTEFVDYYPRFCEWLTSKGERPDEPLPYFVEYVQNLSLHGRVYIPPTPRGTEVQFVPKSGKRNGTTECHHPWGRTLEQSPICHRSK